jgi:mycobactin peptide synthetase MbtE
MTFQERLTESLKFNGDKIAIEYGDRKISYTALFHKADKITRFLLNLELERETIIGISLQDRADVIASVVGVLNANGVFVLLDGALPDNRIESMIENLNLQFIISDDVLRFEALTKKNGVTIQTPEQILKEPDGQADTTRYPDYRADDSIYVYFTSGSTGTPKGIIGKNSSLLQFVTWEIDTFGITGSSRFSQFISPYFDAFMRDVFVPLIAGATICIPPEDVSSPQKIHHWIDDSGITLIHCVPSLFRLFNDVPLNQENFKHLEHILLSGEKIIPSELANWYNTFGKRIQLVNLYGTTETTMIRSYYRIQPEDVNKSRIPAGYPISGTELLILNKDLTESNTLASGDLYIITDYGTKGYLNLPELTYEKFVRINPGMPNEKNAFKTGDKARRLVDGAIELMGREDRQIKLRGIRIEPDEIESTIVRSKLARSAVVIKHTVEGAEESLVAFVIKSERLDNHNQLIRYLKDHLPEYMVPANIVEVDEYPLLSNGKIDFNKLLSQMLVHKTTIVAPADDIEAKILTMWKEILGEIPISTEESFHKMGGSSLSIMRLIGRIYREYNVRISLNEFFSHLTIKKQAEFVKRSGKDSLIVISKSERKRAYNLSSAQQRVYYNYELNKASTAYNLPMAWEIVGGYEKSRVEGALRHLISRHESLRTEFSFEEGKVVQIIKEKVDFTLEEIVLKDQDISGAILGLLKPFDLSKAPLIRCVIIKDCEKRRVLLADVHHIACDGMSQKTLFTDFLKLYRGEVLKPLNIQYSDYAEWEYKFRLTSEFVSHRDFWLKEFKSEVPKLTLPTISLNGNGVSDDGGSAIFSIEKTVLGPMIEALKNEEITTFSALFSVYFIFLSQLSGQDDIVIGINTSGRLQQELNGMVGMFSKTLPVRYRVDPNISFEDFVKGIHKHLLQVNSRQIYDLVNIVADLNKSRTSPVKTLFDVLFVFQNFEEEKMESDEAEFSRFKFETGKSKYPITLFAYEHEDMFLFKLEYLSAYFTSKDIELLVSQFQSLTSRLSRQVKARIIDSLASELSAAPRVEENITFNF